MLPFDIAPFVCVCGRKEMERGAEGKENKAIEFFGLPQEIHGASQ